MAANIKAAKKAAQPKIVITKLNPEQLFKYAKSGLVLLDSERNKECGTQDMFPEEFCLVKPDISKMEAVASC